MSSVRICVLALLGAVLACRPPPLRCSVERDHFFLWVSENAPEREALERAGFHSDGSVTTHSGQGTASVSWFFHNAYLELIWVDDPVAAERKDREGPRRSGFLERSRWRTTGALPVGIGLRPCGDAALPFETWRYQAAWMPAGAALEFATASADLRQPMIFVVPPPLALPRWIWQLRRDALVHPAGVSHVTDACVAVERAGDALQALVSQGVVGLDAGGPALELTFDHGSRHVVTDLRPTLPLRLRY
jgi:hypothetical protein